ncbi:Tspan13 [Phodopus roborovskii]|uniref:Tspan13 protein n=1 Tax=Phodopus roborovskii TaxID=109678 RepID=A0AAU9YRR8_PHORO|nr:Tspan13 [Phodopus roborovskii]
MVCGGFSCSKNCLCALNLLYTRSLSSTALYLEFPAVYGLRWSVCCSLGLLRGASALD